MRITYDKEADAMYIKLSEEKFSKVKIIDKNTILDLDKNNNVIGVELLFVSKRFPQKIPSTIFIENLVANTS